MKLIKRIFFVLLAVCLVSTSSLAAGLQTQSEAEVTPRFTYISDIITGLNISSAGKATCVVSVTMHYNTYSGRINMVLQRNDGSGWEDVKSWTGTGEGHNLDLEKYWYIAPGYEYQVESTLYVYNANGRLVETAVTHSPVKQY